MSPKTEALIRDLMSFEWFQHVGEELPPTVIALNSWNEAIGEYCSKQWAFWQLEMRNRLTAELAKNHPDQYADWNDIVIEIKDAIRPLADKNIELISKVTDVPDKTRGVLQWDILSICTEMEYADVVPPSFFYALTPWYLAGHFPCGWRRDRRSGQLIVY